MASNAGILRRLSHAMMGWLRIATKSAKEKGMSIGAATLSPYTTTTVIAATKRKRAPGCCSIRSSIMEISVILATVRVRCAARG